MEVSSSKVEVVKTILLKAGISLAISVAGYIFISIANRNESSLGSLKSNSQVGDEGNEKTSQESDLEVEILGISSRMKELQKKVIDLEKRFLHYNDLKENEIMLMEFQNKFLTEMSIIEFLEKEVVGLEAENQRFENMLLDYQKALEVVAISRTENQSLQEEVKKLWEKITTHSSLMKAMSLEIEAKEAEISRNNEEMDKMISTIQGMEEETREMRMAIDKLQSEKKELLDKMDEMVMTDISASSKIGGEMVSIEEYNKVVHELEENEKDRAEEAKELIFLRGCHALLMRKNQQQTEEETEGKHQEEPHYTGSEELPGFGSDNELQITSWGHRDDSCLGFSARSRHHSRRPRLIEKFKKWVDGSEKVKDKFDEKEKHEHKLHSGAHSNLIIPARNSCSSA
ncbi:hypothetical protein Leryth_000928 [Lithospermum erythrorhizon]|nr:hypothetical protein Leryth_000928 [Lithospermum erythrorhizon]